MLSWLARWLWKSQEAPVHHARGATPPLNPTWGDTWEDPWTRLLLRWDGRDWKVI